MTDMSKHFPYINEEAEGCRPYNEVYESHLMQSVKNGYVDFTSCTSHPLQAEFCINSKVVGNSGPSWELASIKTKENCPHNECTGVK